MNNFYRSKAGIPRQAKNANTFSCALLAWKDFRLLNVVNACKDDTNSYRKEFGKYHKIFIDKISDIIDKENNEEIIAKELIKYFKDSFKDDLSGPARDAFGICGAELEKIMELDFISEA